MKKYKLIKWYPSLPKELELGTELVYYETIDGYSDQPDYNAIVELSVNEVEDNPEYWAKVEEFDWKMIKCLSYSDIDKILDSYLVNRDGQMKKVREVIKNRLKQ